MNFIHTLIRISHSHALSHCHTITLYETTGFISRVNRISSCTQLSTTQRPIRAIVYNDAKKGGRHTCKFTITIV